MDNQGTPSSAGLNQNGGQPIENAVADMANQIKKLLDKIEDLEAKLANKIDGKSGEGHKDSKDFVDRIGRPKPIDIKDVKKPDEYGGDPKNFRVWFERLKDLLINRSEAWEDVIVGIENYKAQRIPDGAYELFHRLGFAEHSEVYLSQLKSYLRTYTNGSLHERVNNTDK